MPRSSASEMDDCIDPVRAYGMIGLSKEYLAAARVVSESRKGVSRVSYYLYGHSLELSLKAVVVAAKTSERTLRSIGHNLYNAVSAAENTSEAMRTRFTGTHRAVLDLFAPYYDSKVYEYHAPGQASWPTIADLDDFCGVVFSEANSEVRRIVSLAPAT
jgi:hypothetical protein